MVEATPITSTTKPEEPTEPIKGPSKKQIEKEQKKLKNKTKQAITVLCKSEDKPFEQLVVGVPDDNKNAATGRLFVTHFGNGDEVDQDLIIEYASQHGEVKQITILPGNNYGHLVMDSAASAQRIIDSLMDANATLFQKRTLVFFHTALEKEALKKNTVIDFPEAKAAVTGAIPGLYIIDDFVTEDESTELISSLDSTGKWEKLLNRRV